MFPIFAVFGRSISRAHLTCTRISSNCRYLSSHGIAESDLSLQSHRTNRNESIEQLRARLVYQSRKRGNLENGILLSTFVGEFLDKLTPNQLASYDILINRPDNDWDIYYWVTDTKEAPAEFQTDVFQMLRQHVQNENNVLRNQLPPLKPRIV